MGKAARMGLTLVGIALFGTVLYMSAQSQGRVRCEVCVEFRGARDCRVARGESRDKAIQEAVSTACANLVGGVTDTVQCNGLQPASIRCADA
jgi:hypothetical protein